MIELSPAAQSLWAKKSNDGNMLWLPLCVHMSDSAAVAQMLWNRWLPEGVKRVFGSGAMSINQVEKLLVFLAVAHDIGKATPVFQAKPSRPLSLSLDERIADNLALSGLPMNHYSEFMWANKTPHALASQMLLERAGCNKNTSLILGSHHGKPPSLEMLSSCGIDVYGFNFHLEEKGKKAWTALWQELIEYAINKAGFFTLDEIPNPNMPAQVLLSGLLIMIDWIASNTEYFPLIRLEDSLRTIDLEARAKTAWKRLDLPIPWEATNTWMSADLYWARFGFKTPKAIQSELSKAVKTIHSPGILILEAPMGSGKTEAALVVAEIFAYILKSLPIF